MTSDATATINARKDKILSRRYIEGLIADGKHIVIFDGRALKTDAWIKFHPGGDKAIKHMVGRDATDEINALHSEEARQRMLSFQIGRVELPWLNFLPPMQGGKFRPNSGDANEAGQEKPYQESPNDPATSDTADADMNSGIHQRKPAFTDTSMPDTSDGRSAARPSFLDARTREEIIFDTAKYPSLDIVNQETIKRKYRELGQRIRAEGLYNCDYFSYFIECSRYTLLGVLTYVFLQWGWYVASAFCLGCLWHQLVFTAHDAGHMGITHNYHVDSVLGMIIANHIGGLSLGWWKRNHNVHHIVTNAPEHDPDIEHMPIFAVSHRFLTNLRSTYYDRIMWFDAVANVLLRYQNYLYYPILLFGRFNLYRLSWEFMLSNQAPKKGPAWWHRWFEFSGQAFFWAWYAYGILYCTLPDWRSRVTYILVSHMVSSPLHVQITLSHFAMSTADLGVQESFPQKMLRTTMDVDCPQWLDFFHGGLQFQAIHHLFPQIPRHNLRRAQKLVLEFCRDTEIPYAIFTFVNGNKEVIGRLADVAKQVYIFDECRKSAAGQSVFSNRN